MDPNETLKEIDAFLAARRTGEEVDEWSEDLFDWLENGGFEPAWEKYPLGTSYYRCRAGHMRARGVAHRPSSVTSGMKHKGWTVRYFPEGSQVWQALRHGVRLRANSKENLIRMIDTRE